MNANPVRSALDLIDAEPSSEFLSALRARLLADGTAAEASTTTQQPSALTPEIAEEYVMLAPNPNRRGPSRRMQIALLAVAACAAAVAAVVVINRPTSDSGNKGELRDVDAKKALSLGEATLITADTLNGTALTGAGRWVRVDDLTVSDYAEQSAATSVALPGCAQLASIGLMQPTSKSVTVHQDFVSGIVPMLHDVWVFATPEDASRAMDAIAGNVYPTCWFDLFDRLTPLGRMSHTTSTSYASEMPSSIAQHGDRQVIISQRIVYTTFQSGANVEAINAYVQVGRAISFIDPQYLGDVGPNSNVERAIAASTAALQKVFGH